MSDFTVPGLRVVREAVRTGSFSAAAERLGYTQSAISRQVSLMEQVTGRQLFDRHARGVRPTEAGRIVARHAESVLEALDRAQSELRDLSKHATARIRLGAFSTATAALVPRAITIAAQHNPLLTVQLREGTSPHLLTALARRRIDLAVLSGEFDVPDGVELTALTQDTLYLAVPQGHRLAHQSSTSIAALRAEKWIVGSEESHTSLLGAWTNASWQPIISHVARDWVTKWGLVAAGLGITLVPGLAIPALPATIAIVAIDDPAATRRTVLAHTPNPATHIIREALLDASAQLNVELRERLKA
ncbi:DNA-binding transcriptional LysR family regulator [Nocardia tenerifensis]|uniref:DNA-binding transcriptional LysR family regulator n=1 Tax=Nocardia tenerifensis TaxID=228006 RepID=A0A318JU07_9NOCA|nr:LysR substrate-binding domain-containing protein [Nocardia tenerifensis]PXX54928.1 DNA-binding transcriptional LysR family regulator [Nocardia tenerifensis]